VKKSRTNPTKTNQWATPMPVHCSIRVWPMVSLSMVAARVRWWPARVWSGAPSRTTRKMAATARANRATANTE
jgi:hypothetical protein